MGTAPDVFGHSVLTGWRCFRYFVCCVVRRESFRTRAEQANDANRQRLDAERDIAAAAAEATAEEEDTGEYDAGRHFYVLPAASKRVK